MSDAAFSGQAEYALATAEPQPRVFTVNHRSVMFWLWLASGLVWGAGVLELILVRTFELSKYEFITRIYDLDGEACLPAWYSSSLMGFAGVLLFIHSRVLWHRVLWMAICWFALSAIFTYLSLDEEAGIHELFYLLFARDHLTGIWLFAWVIAAIPLVALVGAAFLPFVIRLPPPIRWRVVLSGVVFLSGAVVTEMVEGYVATAYGAQYKFLIPIEEGLEIAGVTMFISALLRSLEHYVPRVELCLVGNRARNKKSRPS